MNRKTPEMIGGRSESRTESGVRHNAKFLISSEDLEKETPALGSRARWASADARVTRVTRQYLAEGFWSVAVEAEDFENDLDLNLRGLSGDGLPGVLEESFDVTSILFPPEWFGCRRATVADCASFLGNGSNRIGEGLFKYLNIHGEWAQPGNVIAENAVPLSDSTTQIGSAKAGSFVFDRSPFTGTIPGEWMFQSIQTRIYHCVFYTRKKINTIDGFTGVSGKFGNRCDPGRTDEPGKWKARYQKLQRVTGPDSRIYTRVEREMIEAPGDLVWDHAKNGGYWIW